MSQSRQLAAIMFTDIVGYTALMGSDSTKALDLVRISKELQKPLVEKYGGQWLKEMGDGALAKFGTALDAVHCAIEIQEQARAKLDGKLRIGVHLGDITVENEDIFGDGVNVAARLESIADPGGIYISDAIEKAIRGQGNVQAKYLGESRLKNVDYPVRTYTIQGVGLPVPDTKNKREITGHFVAELLRRGVFRAIIAYLIVGVFLFLTFGVVRHRVDFPDVVTTILVAVLMLGFPIAIFLAWNYERSPQGFVRTTTKSSWQNPYTPAERKPLTRTVVLIGLALASLVMLLVPRSTSLGDVAINSTPSPVEIHKSIAVLPFTNMSNDPDQQYFSDGMSEEIINALAQIPNLKVASRTSAFQFRGDNQDIKAIATTLGVTTVLEGSVRKWENRVRVTAQLINAADGFHLWSQSFERELDDIFAIQDELSRAIVDALKLKISKTDGSTISRGTINMEAHNLYLRGRHFWNLRDNESVNKALSFFQQAIEQDSTYALAYSGIADSYNMMTYADEDLLLQSKKVKGAAYKAIELDNSVAQAYAALGFTEMMIDWDYQAAANSFKRAISLNPNYASAHQWYSELLQLVGDTVNALSEIDKSIELDPLNLVINVNQARYYMRTGEYNTAIAIAKKVVELNPSFEMAHGILYGAYYEMGDLDAAFKHFRQSEYATWFDDSAVDLYKLSGWKGILGKIIELRSEDPKIYINPVTVAQIYIINNDYDSAIPYLEEAVNRHIVGVIFIGLDPFWRPYHKEPRFQALLKKMGLPVTVN